MKTDNIPETTKRVKCWLGWQQHCATARNIGSSAAYKSPNSAYERWIRSENL